MQKRLSDVVGCCRWWCSENMWDMAHFLPLCRCFFVLGDPFCHWLMTIYATSPLAKIGKSIEFHHAMWHLFVRLPGIATTFGARLQEQLHSFAFSDFKWFQCTLQCPSSLSGEIRWVMRSSLAPASCTAFACWKWLPGESSCLIGAAQDCWENCCSHCLL